MNEMLSLLSSRGGEAAIFVVLVTFTVLSLVRLDAARARGAKLKKTAMALGAVFAAMALGGAAGFLSAGELGFLNLAFFLTGAAGGGVLFAVMTGADDDELRRITAQDL